MQLVRENIAPFPIIIGTTEDVRIIQSQVILITTSIMKGLSLKGYYINMANSRSSGSRDMLSYTPTFYLPALSQTALNMTFISTVVNDIVGFLTVPDPNQPSELSANAEVKLSENTDALRATVQSAVSKWFGTPSINSLYKKSGNNTEAIDEYITQFGKALTSALIVDDINHTDQTTVLFGLIAITGIVVVAGAIGYSFMK